MGLWWWVLWCGVFFYVIEMLYDVVFVLWSCVCECVGYVDDVGYDDGVFGWFGLWLFWLLIYVRW